MKECDYDIVTLLWTLENCGSAKAVIQAAKRMLKPGGKLIVATGSRILVPFKKPLWAYIDDSPADLHPWRFSVRTLINLLSANGFELSHTNSTATSDYLVASAIIHGDASPIGLVDDHNEVIDFFNRWHEDTVKYWS